MCRLVTATAMWARVNWEEAMANVVSLPMAAALTVTATEDYSDGNPALSNITEEVPQWPP